ncbi:zinc finger protein 438 isoform X2 [Globicephala melas]|uniref:zinc finger protein 438 isoform X2 n=1 Tax=Globicephala melas TaxID=9731 RepID=UPI00122F5BA3|nr:zinc finger protein 438 isoform X2 [Globicephala melas]XP_030688131.1 zinc finger protein 438 isoform X1 [Globicephala melas]XP_030688133.1 zinc finger protein 438 isoform X1 [Globicephala melas]XP_030688134.1 zinc finger protein 438 isoform X1 [Globicephala melas]XP_030688135.1 zinc finger protein 438 isoform X1 [Globicephala melas]XP_030688136.1 zinc finger protein 438 isoform X1 [Globicephala melas]XP_030688137.1 zinc finger protein 438 isoform X2 [Globicephala melas]XP_030688138.1 zin
MQIVVQVKDIIMQSASSVPPKDQGGVSLLTSPVEKQLTQKKSASPGKTARTGESNSPPGTIQGGKGLQGKSQFRTIAPKLAPRVLAPSLSDHAHPGPSLGSKALGMPPQNYALMQVAGQEGTFSLVALPHVASAQPLQKPRLPLPKNLKLPIPRYQRPGHSKGARKKPGCSSSDRGCSQAPAQTQAAPPLPEHPEAPHKPSPPKPALAPGQAPASLTSGGGRGDPGPPGTSDHGGRDPPAAPALSTPEEPSAERGLPKSSGRAGVAGKKPSRKPAVARGELREQVDPGRAATHLSPGVTGNAVQVVPSIPRGKLPIPPYSRARASQVYEGGAAVNAAHASLPGLRAAGDKSSSIPEGFCSAPQVADRAPAPQASWQSPCDRAYCPATKADLNHKTKPNGGAAKRRGRKRKVPDELLTFQSKRRKCVSNKCKDGKGRAKAEPQESRDQKPGAVKKYRSIMPKPVLVLPALAPLASPAATLQPPAPGSREHAAFNHSLAAPKHLGCRQDDGPSPKPGSAFRNGVSGLKKPSHGCHVCEHAFQPKQHLRERANTHSDSRPYSCRLCRKAYVRPGSLSAHVRLHHGDSRPRRLVCCEFCAKVFGHVRVYFGHLKEVHGVAVSTEPSPCEPQPQPGDLLRTREQTARGMEGPVDRETKSSLEEDLLLNQADEVKFQIRCGRCQITAQSFAEIKFHLLYVHGEEIQGQLQEELSPSPGSRGAQGELVQQAAPFWKHPERRKQLKHRPLDGELCAVPRLKKQLYLRHQNEVEILAKREGAQPGPSEPGGHPQGPEGPGPDAALSPPRPGFRCVLCAQMLGRKEELLLHWEERHKCEDPLKLWTVLSTLSSQGVIEPSSETGK